MGLFNIFKKKEPLTEEQMKLDFLWDQWRQEQVPAPYSTLMTYYTEITKGSHISFFLNIAFYGKVDKAVEKIGEVLPPILKENLETAYSHYLVLINEENEETESKIRECDAVFDEYKSLITDILQEYANTLEVY